MSFDSNPPQLLGDEDVRERLRDVFKVAHRSHLVAMRGVGKERVLDTDVGSFQVVPVESEIDLRRRLAAIDAEEESDPHVAFLVPWSGTLPLDVGGRFANNGRILPLGKEVRLRRLFNVTQIDDAVLASPLARLLVERPTRERYPSRGGRLTIDAFWVGWLREECRAFDKDDLSLVALLMWAAVDGGGPAFRGRFDDPLGSEVRNALGAFLESRLGPAARVAWNAWESGRGARVLELAVVFDAVAASADPAIQMWRTLKAQSELGLANSDVRTIQALAAAADPALRAMRHRDVSERKVKDIVAAADARIDVDEVRRAAVKSRWLPSAWTGQLDRLGRVLLDAARDPKRTFLEAAVEHLRELEKHEDFHTNQQAFTRAEMACRLLAWLLDPMDERYPAMLPRYAEVTRLARWYAHEGGFVDWARRVARGTAVNAFGEGVSAIVSLADAKRTTLDRTFAKALSAWLEAGRPAQHVMPIHQVVDRLVARPLEAAKTANIRAAVPDRRFLVLLLDGMAWAQAVELMLSMTNWGPVAWNGSRATGIEVAAAYAPVLAHLPTVTEVSRAAFFAGKDPSAGREEPTSKDEERWRDHPIRNYFATGDAPRLLLRAEGHTPDGSASLEALNAVRDSRVPVVAMVINAIDASLKGDTQQHMRWDLSAIRSLADLLDAARDAGRLVLLASDHGHVPADRLTSCGSPHDARARWRPWNGRDEVAEHEVTFPKGLAWAPRGAEGVVMIADDEHRYGGAAHAGEHGGASLAEVVAPAVLLGYDAPTPFAAQDPEMRVGAAHVPRWWFFETEMVPVLDRKAAPAPKPTQQLTLIETEQRPVAAAPPKKARAEDAPLHPMAASLAQSKLFKDRTPDARRKSLLQVVSYLAARDDRSATIASFATHLGLLPTRTQGLIATLAESLNVDGYTLLWHDSQTQRVYLDVEKLHTLYELS